VGLLIKGCESRRGERQRRERKGRGEERERRGEEKGGEGKSSSFALVRKKVGAFHSFIHLLNTHSEQHTVHCKEKNYN